MQNEPYPQTCIVNSLYANRTNEIQNEGTTCTWSGGQPGRRTTRSRCTPPSQNLISPTFSLKNLSRLATTFRF